jgi:Kef-type K+ transport system membrane component KefB
MTLIATHLLAAGALSPDVENRLLLVLMQLAVIIIVARLFAIVFRRYLGQTAVVGEICAGLALGPSVFGRLERLTGSIVGSIGHSPRLDSIATALQNNQFSASLFNHSVDPIMSIMSQLGLIFLLFLIGLEFDFGHLKNNGRTAISVSLAGILLPFLLGMALAWCMYPYLPEGASHQLNPRGFVLFVGTAMSITAIPILGRIMSELNMTRTRLGTIIISAAAIDDATAWIILATISAMVRSHFDAMATLRMIGLTVAYGLFMTFLARPVLTKLIRWELRRNEGEISLNGLAVTFAFLFLSAIITNLIGIFSIFGAFILGAVLSSEIEFRDAVMRQLRNFVTAFFLPIFFTMTGLRTDIGTLHSAELWIFAGLVSALAILGKFGGCGIMGWIGGFNLRESACIGVMMNTRALMELIVINVGYDLKVIPASVFCMLVMMAVLTTIMTTPLLMILMRGTEIEPYIVASGFRRITPAPVVAAAPSA